MSVSWYDSDILQKKNTLLYPPCHQSRNQTCCSIHENLLRCHPCRRWHDSQHDHDDPSRLLARRATSVTTRFTQGQNHTFIQMQLVWIVNRRVFQQTRNFTNSSQIHENVKTYVCTLLERHTTCCMNLFLTSCSLLDRHYCLLLFRNNSLHFLQTLLPSWHTRATSHHVPTAGSTPLLRASNPHSPHPLVVPCSNHTPHNWPNWRKSTFKQSQLSNT